MTTYHVHVSGGTVGAIGENPQVNFGGVAPGPPLQRMQRAAYFTDREDELARLLDDLQPGAVATLCGPGGIGKTALAAEAVWTLFPDAEPPDRFPDGVIWHNFYLEPQADLALEAIARAYNEEPRPTPRAAALRALSGKRALLILDGAEAADDLRAVLDVHGSCGVLVTSRTRRDAVAERQDMTPLEGDDAVALLRKWGAVGAAGDTVADDAVVTEICALVGNLPLAVRLAGRYLAETGEHAGKFLELLRKTPLEALDQGERREESVNVLLGKSLAQVSTAACRVLGVVGLLAMAPFRREAIAAALDRPVDDLRKPLDELVRYSLLARSGERYNVTHALIHTYAREQVYPDAAAATRLAAYYNALARAEREQGLEGYRRLDAERGHIMRVLHASTEQAAWPAVRALVWAVENYLDLQGYRTE